MSQKRNKTKGIILIKEYAFQQFTLPYLFTNLCHNEQDIIQPTKKYL